MEVLALNADQTMSSLEIAELTGKQHKHVMRDIRSLIDQDAITAPMHGPSEYKDASGKSNTMFNLDFEAAQYLLNKYNYRADNKISVGVYLLESQGFYKIGATTDVVKRVKVLQCGNPSPIKVVLFCQVDKARKVEKALHHKYSSRNVSGEWFKLSKKEVSEVSEIIKGKYNLAPGEGEQSLRKSWTSGKAG